MYGYVIGKRKNNFNMRSAFYIQSGLSGFMTMRVYIIRLPLTFYCTLSILNAILNLDSQLFSTSKLFTLCLNLQ